MPQQIVSATDDQGWAEADWCANNGWEGRQRGPRLLAPELVALSVEARRNHDHASGERPFPGSQVRLRFLRRPERCRLFAFGIGIYSRAEPSSSCLLSASASRYIPKSRGLKNTASAARRRDGSRPNFHETPLGSSQPHRVS